jgi:hypothetical protein
VIVGLVLVALVVVAALVLVLRRHRSSMPAGWSAITNGNSYGAVADPSGSFDFPLLPSGVHYVTKASPPLAGKTGVRMRYRITAEPGVDIFAASVPGAPSIGPTLHLQRKGDNWSGRGEFESYRWWATFASPMPIVPGEHEIIAQFDQRWTAVETSDSSTSPQVFLDALEQADRIGFTFGGGTGYGHGVYATGKARFELLSFDIV